MKQLAFVLLYLNIAVVIDAQSKISDGFHDASDKCFQQQHVPQRYKASFQSFEYANEEIVHKYIHCMATELDIWDNSDGFNIEKIHHQYRAKANEEVVLPIITNCNRNSQNTNKELWCYRAFLCILNTDVGKWFKEDVQRSRPSNVPNGHH